MPNRLAQESSPYLRQHMNNPVDWYPWGPEALARARAEDKPILLSVGYAACHWCHVMEHESFEDPEVAALMNARFVSIKVDREERPDIDHIYMTACHLFTGSGGWPLTVFMTPDLRPYFAGTYFPKEDKYGRPGFKRILHALHDAYRNQRGEVEEQARRFHEALQGLGSGPQRKEAVPLGADSIEKAAQLLLRRLDPLHGGFGGAPKFPNTLDLMLLEAAARRGNKNAGDASLLTCQRMAEGGIHDHLGGGFHRYSVDEKWLVPHFEKMLYDNALIPRVFLSAYRRTGHMFLARVVEDLLEYVRREMTSPDGAFYATQDADSEGEEGKFFVWRPEEITAVVGAEAGAAFCRRYGVTAAGNFEHGTTVLHLAEEMETVAREIGRDIPSTAALLEDARRKLFLAREARVKPARDEKVLAGWNGLMCSAHADAASTLGRPEYLQRATTALDFILTRMRTPDGGIHRVFASDGAKIPGFLEDYGFVARALCDVHRAGADVRYLHAAKELCEQILTRFYDENDPGFFATEAGAADLLVRARSSHDEAVPSGASLATGAMLYVGTLLGAEKLTRRVDQVLERHAGELATRPTAYASLTLVLDLALRGVPMVVVSGGEGDALLQRARALSDASVMVIAAEAGAARTIVEGKGSVDGKSAAYVCANQACQAPVTDGEGLREALGKAGLHASVQPRHG